METIPIELTKIEQYLMSLAKNHIKNGNSFDDNIKLIYEIIYGVYSEDQDIETIYSLLTFHNICAKICKIFVKYTPI